MLIGKKLVLLWSLLQFCLLTLLQQAFDWWIISIYAVLIIYGGVNAWQQKVAASLKLANIVAALITAALLLNLRQAGVLHFMLQILLLSAILRLLALHHLHEARQLIWVHYFLLGSCFILHQDMLIAFVILALFGVNCYGHYKLFAPPTARLNPALTSKALLIILPLWLGMFLLFPRLPPFWQIPNAKVASTGLSDSLDPGSIEKLVQDDSLAFRVEFNGNLPERDQLYWRSYLYEQFDGRRWQVHPIRRQPVTPQTPRDAEPQTSKLAYRIIAESSQQRNLFSLGLPVQHSNGVRIASGGLVRADKPVSQRFSYQLTSDMIAVPIQTNNEREINLQVAEGNPAAKAFAEKLQVEHSTPTSFVNALARFFNQQDFYYSLTPPALGHNGIDQFLFETRTGFCSHYASATALILRHAGIPARVVGGYQGGDWHPSQGYLAVRQREAHAWVEYLDQGVWQRFDPTAAVAPERILQSLDMALPDNERAMLQPFWQHSTVLQAISLQLMHLDYYWSVWVLGFDDTRQQSLWRNLRQHAKYIVYAAITLGVSILLILLFWFYRHHKGVKVLPMAQLLYRALKPALMTKPASQSISVCLTDLAQRFPEHATLLQSILQHYEQAVYAENQQAAQQLKLLLRQHKPALKQLNRAVKNS